MKMYNIIIAMILHMLLVICTFANGTGIKHTSPKLHNSSLVAIGYL